MPKSILGKTVNLTCGASVTVGECVHGWVKDGKELKIVSFHVYDPNHSFDDSDGDERHLVELAISRQAIPNVIRLLSKVYKQTSERELRKKALADALVARRTA